MYFQFAPTRCFLTLEMVRKQWYGSTLIVLLTFFYPTSLFAGTIYYASTNGSSLNTGSSRNSPWPLAYAISHIGSSNTLVVMSGTYAGEVDIRTSYVTLRSETKWGARFINSAGPGLATYPAHTVHDVVVDGFEIANAAQNGITIYGSNVTVRNCWVHDSGQAHGVNVGSGIFSALPWLGTLIERNLLEHNGYSVGYDHGIYISGTNCIVRGNVCRENLGAGIQIYDNHGGASANVQLYNNLCYNNNRLNTNADYQLIIYSAPKLTNFVFGNTLVATRKYSVSTHFGTVLFTNNIIISTYLGVDVYSPSTVLGDYNLTPKALPMGGLHDIITNVYGFVNPSAGLYWLSTDSPARGRAFASGCGPVDFFNNAQLLVTDIGAFQHSAAYSSNSPPLNSSVIKPDYWAIGSGLMSPTNLHVVSPVVK